jgi:hypothetical protein
LLADSRASSGQSYTMEEVALARLTWKRYCFALEGE